MVRRSSCYFSSHDFPISPSLSNETTNIIRQSKLEENYRRESTYANKYMYTRWESRLDKWEEGAGRRMVALRGMARLQEKINESQELTTQGRYRTLHSASSRRRGETRTETTKERNPDSWEQKGGGDSSRERKL